MLSILRIVRLCNLRIMAYQKINENDLVYFKSICSETYVSVSEDDRKANSSDYTEDLSYLPEVVISPKDAQEISQILKHCNSRKIPVTPRGAGTGLSGGALPVYGGVVIATHRFNKVLDVDTNNYQATVEPGVINQVFSETVAEHGLFYPPDPASWGSCFMGGNLAENSGGPKAVKYGVTKDYVLNLEMVLPNGEIIWTGANVLKNSTGYNLTQLVTGSEGTLGIITKIVVRLIKKPAVNLLMMASFTDINTPCEAVSAILNAGITPSALEFMERNAVLWSMKYADIDLQLTEDTDAILIIEVDGNSEELLLSECEKINDVLEGFGCSDVLFAQTDLEKERLWKVRRICGEAVHAHSIYKEEDTVVPRYSLSELLKEIKKIGSSYGFESVCYGHAGDGNLHVNILKGTLSDDQWEHTVKHGIREIFNVCHRLGGTISGEHGIGWVQKEYMNVVFNSTQLALMQGIKDVFDPKHIMNPGKIIPEF